jgi:hypothetical protein
MGLGKLQKGKNDFWDNSKTNFSDGVIYVISCSFLKIAHNG